MNKKVTRMHATLCQIVVFLQTILALSRWRLRFCARRSSLWSWQRSSRKTWTSYKSGTSRNVRHCRGSTVSSSTRSSPFRNERRHSRRSSLNVLASRKGEKSCARGRYGYWVTARAVRIELFTARLLCRASYRVLKYSTETGSSY